MHSPSTGGFVVATMSMETKRLSCGVGMSPGRVGGVERLTVVRDVYSKCTANVDNISGEVKSGGFGGGVGVGAGGSLNGGHARVGEQLQMHVLAEQEHVRPAEVGVRIEQLVAVAVLHHHGHVGAVGLVDEKSPRCTSYFLVLFKHGRVVRLDPPVMSKDGTLKLNEHIKRD